MDKNQNQSKNIAWNSTPLLPVAWGEVFDKFIILQIKANFLQKSDTPENSQKLQNVLNEKHLIQQVIGDLQKFPPDLQNLISQLHDINLQLWHIEDAKRNHERQKLFDDDFIELARNVYLKNDKRAQIKKQINLLLGSQIVEEKSYQKY